MRNGNLSSEYKKSPSACFYLGLINDSKNRPNIPSPLNQCRLSEPKATPSLGHQRQVCLKRSYKECPVYTRLNSLLPGELRWKKTVVLSRRSMLWVILPFLASLLIFMIVKGIQVGPAKPVPVTGNNPGNLFLFGETSFQKGMFANSSGYSIIPHAISSEQMWQTSTRVPFLLQIYLTQVTNTFVPTIRYATTRPSPTGYTVPPGTRPTRAFTHTPTATPIATKDSISTPTLIITITPTISLTYTPSFTPTPLPTLTFTVTSIISLTPSITPTPTITKTPRLTRTPAPTNTKHPTATPKITPTITSTIYPTPTPTGT